MAGRTGPRVPRRGKRKAYSSAGEQFGYSLLWTMIPMAIALAIAQELAARTGVVTGKGLSELIREEYGLRTTFLLMAALVRCPGDFVSTDSPPRIGIGPAEWSRGLGVGA